MLQAIRGFLKENDMMAYLAMMAVRIIELQRVLKPTGSLYLHCDPTASHYLKLLLDAVFSPVCFRNEIIWRRKALFQNAFESQRNFEQAVSVRFWTNRAPTPPSAAWAQMSAV